MGTMLSRTSRQQFRIFLKEFIVVFLVFCTLLSYQFYKKYEPTIFLTPVDSIPNELFRSGAKEKFRTPEIRYESRLAVSKVVNREFKSEAQKVQHHCRNAQLNISKTLEGLSDDARSTFFKHIAVDDDAKILYCVPSGLTTTSLEKIQQTFSHVAGRHRRDHGHVKSSLNSSRDTSSVKLRKTLSGLKDDQVKHKLSTYFKFMFAEEPISRLLFVYNTKIVKQGQKKEPLRKNDFMAVKQFRKFFTNFLYYVIASGSSLSDEDILPLATLCQPCIVKYDFIGDVENFSQDLVSNMRQYHKFLNRELHHKLNNSSMKLQANLVMHVKKGVDKMREDVAFVENCPPAPMGVIKKVAKKYTDDFTLFGYKLQET